MSYVFDDGCCPHGKLIDLNARIAEARRAALTELRERVAGLPGSGRTGSGYGGNIDRMVWATDAFVSRAAVLAEIDRALGEP